MCSGWLICLTLLMGLFWGQNSIFALYTNHEDVLAVISNAMPYVIGMLCFDCLQTLLQGCIVGLGVQKWAAVCAFVCYYLIGLPVSYLLGIVCGFGCTGLWTGLFVADCIISICYLTIILKTNWRKIAEEASQRINV